MSKKISKFFAIFQSFALISNYRSVDCCNLTFFAVHHDLKPSNIFISTENDPLGYGIIIQLGDFGLACPLQQTDNTKHLNAMGTPLYSAPEQLSGKCDKKSDIYSLGVIFIELLVKCVTEMERFDMIASISAGKVPDKMDPDFCGFIRK
jgi:serine/threonine protein kinase